MFLFLFVWVLGSPKCAVLIDAGSSGSRFWIYSWTAHSDTWETSIPSDLKSTDSYKAKPGIIEYFTNTTAMEIQFQAGLDEVLAYIDGEYVFCQDTADIPMWLMSTAGLRTESNQDVRDILDAIGEWMVANVPFKWQFAALLSGEEEAIYAWVATNHVLGRFESGNRVGIMEMGGQSMQIAFEPVYPIIMDNSYDIVLFGNTYRVYASSWNGFGYDAIIDSIYRIIDKIYGDKELAEELFAKGAHPCLPVGWKNWYSSIVNWVLEGGYNNTSCTRLIDTFYNQYTMSEMCGYSECSIAGQYVSDMKSVNFYAMSNFYHMVETLNKLDDTLGFSPSMDSLHEAIEKYCALNITELRLQVDKYFEEYNAVECMHSKIIISLLRKLPNFGVQSTVTYKTAEDANGLEGSWLLGALIYQMYHIDSSDEKNISVEGDEVTSLEEDKVTYIAEDKVTYLPHFITFVVLFFIVTVPCCYLLYQTKIKTKKYEGGSQKSSQQFLESANLKSAGDMDATSEANNLISSR